jgi:hypothetical protein
MTNTNITSLALFNISVQLPNYYTLFFGKCPLCDVRLMHTTFPEMTVPQLKLYATALIYSIINFEIFKFHQ